MRNVALALTITLTSSLAAAETPDRVTSKSDHAAPARAWELTLGQGYSQGFGSVSSNTFSLRDYANGGPSLQLGLGYRVNPHWMVGGYLEGATFFRTASAEDDTRVYSAASGLQGTYFVLPFATVDPWLSLGTGARWYAIDHPSGKATTAYGFDLVRARAGVEYKLGSSASVGPMVGASVTTFTHEGQIGEEKRIDDQRVSTFVFAGMQGRFDIGGVRITPPGTSVASR